MPLKVAIRRDTGTLWITGTVRASGADQGHRVRKAAGTTDMRLALKQAALIERRLLDGRRRQMESHRKIEALPGLMKPIMLEPQAIRPPRGYASGNRGSVILYVMESVGLVKVGLSADMTKRMKSLAAASPVPVRLAGSQEVRGDVAAWAEYLAHLALSDCHSHSEWFRCDVDRALAVVKAAVIRAEGVPSSWVARGNNPLWFRGETNEEDQVLSLADEKLKRLWPLDFTDQPPPVPYRKPRGRGQRRQYFT